MDSNVDNSSESKECMPEEDNDRHNDEDNDEDNDKNNDEEKDTDLINYLGGTNSEIVFNLSEEVKKFSNEDISDDFFELTKEDLVVLLNDLRRQQVGDNERQIETKRMREQRESKKMDKYKSSIIRISFPYDKLVLQAVFKPNDNIQQIMAVISNYVEEDVVNHFHLYTAPPKQLLKPDSTLFELQLVPAANIHFGVKPSMSGKPVLKAELKEKVTSHKAVEKLTLNLRMETIGSPNSLSNSSETSDNVKQVSNQSSSGSRLNPTQKKNDNRVNKIPKWFKTNK